MTTHFDRKRDGSLLQARSMNTKSDTYRLTTRNVAQRAGVGEATVRLYSDLGLLACVRDTNSRRLFNENAPDQVIAIMVSRLRKAATEPKEISST